MRREQPSRNRSSSHRADVIQVARGQPIRWSSSRRKHLAVEVEPGAAEPIYHGSLLVRLLQPRIDSLQGLQKLAKLLAASCQGAKWP